MSLDSQATCVAFPFGGFPITASLSFFLIGVASKSQGPASPFLFPLSPHPATCGRLSHGFPKRPHTFCWCHCKKSSHLPFFLPWLPHPEFPTPGQMAVGQNQWFHVGVGEFTTHFRFPILVVMVPCWGRCSTHFGIF